MTSRIYWSSVIALAASLGYSGLPLNAKNSNKTKSIEISASEVADTGDDLSIEKKKETIAKLESQLSAEDMEILKNFPAIIILSDKKEDTRTAVEAAGAIAIRAALLAAWYVAVDQAFPKREGWSESLRDTALKTLGAVLLIDDAKEDCKLLKGKALKFIKKLYNVVSNASSDEADKAAKKPHRLPRLAAA